MNKNQELSSLYGKFKNEVKIPQDLQGRLSPPLLLYPSDRWNEATVRVLIVGQETLGWGFTAGEYYDWPYQSILSFADFLAVDNSVEAMIHGYKAFEFARYQPENYNSPFWGAYRQIRRNFDDEVDGINTAVLWTNLFRMSLDGGSVINNGKEEEIKCIQSATRGILSSEIDNLKPNIVIFFTGPNYNKALYSEFEGIILKKFNELDQYQAFLTEYPFLFDESRTAWIEHPSLPEISIRTYHPGFSARGYWQLIDAIEQAIVAKAKNKDNL